jgi:hypothetical protein
VTTTEARTPNRRKRLGLPPTTDIPACDISEPAHLHIKHERTAAPQPWQIAALQIGLI